MANRLPVYVLEPERESKRDNYARLLIELGQRAEDITELLTIDEIKSHLKSIREDARNNIYKLINEFETNLKQSYPDLQIKSAIDYMDATRYIEEKSQGIKIISINNSSVVTQELKHQLELLGFSVINSYLHEYEVEQKKIEDYWDLPRLTEKNLKGTFNIVTRYDGIPDAKNKEYLALLGVNAVSASDGTVFFLEHFSNIDKDLKQANKVFLVIGIDKIVKNKEDAYFQTRCMGIFGLENIILSIAPHTGKITSIDDLNVPITNKTRELHVIILDNGRLKMLDSKYSDLFLCIGCRACNKHCPIRHSFYNVDYIWTPKNYLNQFLYGSGRSLDICLHCEACRIECPVDINLPHLMWLAKKEFLDKRGTTLSHKIMGRPEILAKLGSLFAPIANLLMKLRSVRIPMEFITGIDRRTNLPEFHFRTFRKWYKKHGAKSVN